MQCKGLLWPILLKNSEFEVTQLKAKEQAKLEMLVPAIAN